MASYVDNFLTYFGFDSKDAEHGAESLTAKFDEMAEHIERISHIETFKFLAEVGHRILEKMEGVGDAAEQLENMAYAAGVSTTALQKLQYSAQQAGVGPETVTMSINHLSRALDEVKRGSKEATETFTKIGIPKEQVMSFRNGQDAMLAVADRIRGVTDATQRNAIAQQIFGRNAGASLKWMSQGAKGIMEVGDEGERLGAVVKSYDLHNLAETGDAISSIWMIVKGVSTTLMAKLAPAIKFVVEKVRDWWAANRAVIEGKLESWVKLAAEWLTFFAGVISGTVDNIVDWVAAHRAVIEAIEETARAIAVDLGAAMLSMFGWISDFLANNPNFLKGIRDWAIAIGAAATAYFVMNNWMTGAYNIMKWGYDIGMNTAKMFNGIKAALLGINWEMVGLIALFGVIVLSLQAVWEMLHGKSIQDTWVGQMFGIKSKPGGLFDMLGSDNKSFEVGPDGKVRARARKADGTIDESKLSAGPAPQNAQNASGLGFAGMLQGMGNFSSLASMSSDPSITPGAAALPPMMSMPPGNTTLNAPMTINVNGSADPEATQRTMERVANNAFDRLLRNAATATAPNKRM